MVLHCFVVPYHHARGPLPGLLDAPMGGFCSFLLFYIERDESERDIEVATSSLSNSFGLLIRDC